MVIDFLFAFLDVNQQSWNLDDDSLSAGVSPSGSLHGTAISSDDLDYQAASDADGSDDDDMDI